MNLSFIRWLDKSRLNVILQSINNNALEDFYNDRIKGNYQSARGADAEFITNFKPFPEKWESFRQLFLAMLNSGEKVDGAMDSENDIYIVMGKNIKESWVEPILDVLEDWPCCGVSRVADKSWTYITTPSMLVCDGEDWVIKPKEMGV